MLATAAFWRQGARGGVGEALSRPELAHYVDGWPRAGDRGVIAEDGGPVGAAWLRFLPASDPGFGFVAAAIPELSLAVEVPWRRRGVGTSLLSALLTEARDAGLAAVSLSVEPDNHARRLYARAGFHDVEQVGDPGGSITMLLHL